MAPNSQKIIEIPQAGNAGLIGRFLGPYRISAKLSEDQTAVLYAASDQHSEVVIKVLKRAADGYRNDRQSLTRLKHPNIARLLDTGITPEGRPYFAMERIDGHPIDRYCRERALSVLDRLKLFEQVCAAVDYAHRNLILHCGLEPAKILILADGSPKVIDFGMDIDAPPEYASPEQVRGDSLTTASDIYSLGVILYELLAGGRPFGDQPDSPTPPSAADKALRGDLDAIVLTAVHEAPARRYVSAAELATDIRRHLERQPISAGRPAASHRAGAFVRRHRAFCAAAALFVVSLIGGIAGALYTAHVARARALQRFDAQRKLTSAFLVDLNAAMENVPARSLIVARALEFLENLARDAGRDLSLLRELAAAYERVAALQGFPGGSETLSKAIAMRETVAAADPKNVTDGLALAAVYGDYANQFLKLDPVRQQQFTGKALDIRERLYAAHASDREATRALGRSYWERSNPLCATADYQDCLEWRLRALHLYDEAAYADPSARNRRSVAVMHKSVSAPLQKLRDYGHALEHSREAVAIDESLAASDPLNAAARRDLSASYKSAAESLLGLGRPEEALDHARKSLEIRRQLSAAEPADAGLRSAVARAAALVGDAQLKIGRNREAARLFREAIAALESMPERAPDLERLREQLRKASVK